MFHKELGLGMPVRHTLESSWLGLHLGQRDERGDWGSAGLVRFPALYGQSPAPGLPSTCLSEAQYPIARFSKTHHQPCFPGRKEGGEENVVVTVLASHRNTENPRRMWRLLPVFTLGEVMVS